MAIDISPTLYGRKDLRLSTRIAAEELAKLARPDGTVKIAYRYLAFKMNVCKRTAIRCVGKLVQDLEILEKKVRRRPGSKLHDWNVYRFCIKFRRMSAHPFNSDKFSKLSPTPKTPEEERRELRLEWEEELRNHEKAIRLEFVTPGSDAYARCQEEIARLKKLLEPAP
jgi:hypothetical protein